jgi:hypothetical protein
MQWLKDVLSGLRRHPANAGKASLTCFSLLFTFVKVSVQFFPGLKIVGPSPLIAGIFFSIFWGAYSVRKLARISFKIANCNTTIEVFFGDIFEQDGITTIPVSAYFETQLGKPVSDISLHGIFIKKFFSDFPRELDAQIDEQLKGEKFERVEKAEGKDRCYRIGTTALVKAKGDRYILFAFTNADAITLKASSDVELMWRALHMLWERARNEASGHPVNLPLVGSGLSNLGLTSRDLLNLLILSAITETKAKDITRTVRIVLHRSRFDEVDLREIKRHWKGN